MKNINEILGIEIEKMDEDTRCLAVCYLEKRLQIEFKKQDKSGIYGVTQYMLAYNSNKIEGSQLTEKQTISLFETGTILASGEIVRAKDVEETTGHFMMFNEMLSTYQQPLSQELIKKYHFRLKSGVFEDLANGYVAGEYKRRPNRVGNIETAMPQEVPEKMQHLLEQYETKKEIGLKELAWFHLEYEKIHPFQDGNGRTGRLLLFKECLRNSIVPFIILDEDKAEYYHALQENNIEVLEDFFKKEQGKYYQSMQKYLMEYVPEKEEKKETIPKL